jgi:hypothetical protein
MPDRKLKIEELVKLTTEGKAGRVKLDACKLFLQEGSEPSLHDMVLGELIAKTEALANLLIDQGRELRRLKEETKKREVS